MSCARSGRSSCRTGPHQRASAKKPARLVARGTRAILHSSTARASIVPTGSRGTSRPRSERTTARLCGAHRLSMAVARLCLDSLTPERSTTTGTWAYVGGGTPSMRRRRSCSAVFSNRSAPRTTLFTPIARSSTTTASGYDAMPSRRRTMKSPTVRLDPSTRPCTRSMNAGTFTSARTRRALPLCGSPRSRHVPGYRSSLRSSRRVQPQAKHLSPSCLTARSWASRWSLCR